MEGIVLSVCFVSAVFNVIMFIHCVKLRNECIKIKDLYLKGVDKTERVMKDAQGALHRATSQMLSVASVLEEIANEADGDC